jgi:serine phosphatase RsbU (regulator of sigma subunit)
MLGGEPHRVDTYPFRPGEQLLLYTDGVTETRDAAGTFYPLAERLRSWGSLPPHDLLERLHDDLLDYSRKGLQDDTAALAVSLLADDASAPSTPSAPSATAG